MQGKDGDPASCSFECRRLRAEAKLLFSNYGLTPLEQRDKRPSIEECHDRSNLSRQSYLKDFSNGDGPRRSRRLHVIDNTDTLTIGKNLAHVDFFHNWSQAVHRLNEIVCPLKCVKWSFEIEVVCEICPRTLVVFLRPAFKILLDDFTGLIHLHALTPLTCACERDPCLRP